MEYLVLDVGGSAIKYALMNDELEMLEKGKVPTPKEGLEEFKQAVQSIYQKYQERVDGIAMSLPGLINKHTRLVQVPGALEYNLGVDILAELQSVTTNRLTIENDAKCAALCEVEYGSLKGTDVGAVCIIGSGIGGGVTIGDKVFTGTHGFAGEFSYLSTDWTKQVGFEAKWGFDSSALYLVASIAHAVGEDPKTFDGMKAFEYCNQGDERALTALKAYTDKLVMGLFNIQATVDPDKIAVGGGISQQPILHEYIQKSLDQIYEKMPIPIPRVQIVPCTYYNDSNLVGALANYKKTYNA
ncbi:MAG: ROK family protein [Longibaculum muris]|uniref:Putative NBD/HSP70 family sugar kinase n=1 Tax=Longibaculum muris TaxID=1796628 RepID=A0A4R3Z8X2_9FIRM|nr:ROK family protein [Longibaculum muris]KXU49964.1 ROK family protein [Candidatus Stoquefichus sp. KLE1796]MBS5368073.1 ROK family protein [Coprobacillus cateniformis]MCR1887485.1 ROK family protein [Longibaculum muris]MED9811797.1 ROK family protein [Longibaculum muris]TCW00798.1 putative NBD/HSP70 family sugar kinase [Longibaculum muris]